MASQDGSSARGQLRLVTRPSEDPRASRTRQAIFVAVERLTAAGADSITVSDLVREAQISRSSFYAHFSDIDEVAVAYLAASFDEVDAALKEAGTRSGVEAARLGYRALVAHLVDHYALYRTVSSLQPMRKAYEDTVTAHATTLFRTLATEAGVPSGISPDVVAAYVAGGSLTVIRAWLQGSLDLSDDDVVEQLIGLLPEWVTASA